jgi:hypothetical protein
VDSVTSPTPFAGVPTLRDAEPAHSPPAQVTATSALAVTPSSQGAFSIPPGHLRESKICAHCSERFYRYSKTGPSVWARRTHCSKPKCANIADRLRKLGGVAVPRFPEPTDCGREAELFAGLSFTDSPHAPASLPRFTKLPEPQRSLSGNGTAMCAVARQT